ncbi:hypothetical protein QJS66_22180 [Kocuria rhizophila]|nr:hypothetical protein QJS66_22180 [Kocuria rhizophila]
MTTDKTTKRPPRGLRHGGRDARVPLRSAPLALRRTPRRPRPPRCSRRGLLAARPATVVEVGTGAGVGLAPPRGTAPPDLADHVSTPTPRTAGGGHLPRGGFDQAHQPSARQVCAARLTENAYDMASWTHVDTRRDYAIQGAPAAAAGTLVVNDAAPGPRPPARAAPRRTPITVRSCTLHEPRLSTAAPHRHGTPLAVRRRRARSSRRAARRLLAVPLAVLRWALGTLPSVPRDLVDADRHVVGALLLGLLLRPSTCRAQSRLYAHGTLPAGHRPPGLHHPPPPSPSRRGAGALWGHHPGPRLRGRHPGGGCSTAVARRSERAWHPTVARTRRCGRPPAVIAALRCWLGGGLAPP